MKKNILEINQSSKKAFALLILLLLCFTSYAEGGKKVSGKVVDDNGDALPGVTVVVKGSTTGTITSVDGEFVLSDLGEKDILLFSFIGMEPEEVVVGNNTNLTVVMELSSMGLDEIVAIGYGVQKKKEITGAISQVKSEDLEQVVSSDFTSTLQGKVAGVSVTQSNGRPGEQANIQIRGLGSISSNASPLYVVDGIPYDSNPNIPTEDIASLDILKDGASAAVYGTRASNGVILINTKKGKVGQTKVSASAYYGIQNVTDATPLLTTPEYLYVDEMLQIPNGEHSSKLYFNGDAMDYSTNAVDDIINNNASIQNYSVSLSGGKEDIAFNFSTNYFKQDGIIINSGYDRFTTRLNGNLSKGKFDAFVSAAISHSNKAQEPWAIYEYAMYQEPYRPSIADMPQTDNILYVSGQDPDKVGYLGKLLNQTDDRVENSYNIAANLKYEILEGLTFQVNLGMNNWQYKRLFWQPQLLIIGDNGEVDELGSRRDATLTTDYQSSLKYTMENLLTYTKNFNSKHFINALAGYTIERSDNDVFTSVKQDFISNDTQVPSAGKTPVSIGGTETKRRIVGKLLRAQYNYDGKYFVSGSIRQDGSSVFGENNRYGYFPGVSVGWNISEEAFMSNAKAIDNLKLRASYGEVGNQGIDPYLYAAYIDANIDYIWGAETNDVLGSGAIQRGYGNPNVRWETNISRNIGVDLVMFKGKLNFTADVYKNDKQDMLLSLLLPPSTGTTVPNDWNNQYNSIIENVGDMVNKGIELSASYNSETTWGLKWGLNGTFTKNVNEVTNLGGLGTIPLDDSKPGSWRAAQQDVTTYMKEGYEAASFFLIETAGIIKNQNQLDEVKSYMPNAQLGDVILIDQPVQDTDGDGVLDAGDGVIDDNDRVYQGSGMPKFEAGLNFNGEYKGFDLYAQLYYSHGAKIYNGAKHFAYSENRHKDMYYMWTPHNSNSDIPAGRQSNTHDNFRTRNDFFLENGTYLRIRSLVLGYTIPKKVMPKIEKLRFYISAQNPFTFTSYDGFDPEVGGDGVATRGIDKSNYPPTRMFLLGVNIDF